MGDMLSVDITSRFIRPHEPVFLEIHRVQQETSRILYRLNAHYLEEDAFRDVLMQLFGKDIDSSVTILPPFYTDFGRHTQIGKDVFINRGVMLTDLGGITLEDHVLIGPFAKLITVNHPANPEERRGVYTKPIVVRRRAWIGAGATILPGVTVGENAIVAADATVTKDVPPNVTVAGTPARIIAYHEEHR